MNFYDLSSGSICFCNDIADIVITTTTLIDKIAKITILFLNFYLWYQYIQIIL